MQHVQQTYQCRPTWPTPYMSLFVDGCIQSSKDVTETPEGEAGVISLLRDAQRHPEALRGLMVRVVGYNAFFVELCKDVQDEFISRTMLENSK